MAPTYLGALSIVSMALTNTGVTALLITHFLFPMCTAALRNLTDFAFSCPLLDLTTLTYCLLPRGRKALPRNWVPFQRAAIATFAALYVSASPPAIPTTVPAPQFRPPNSHTFLRGNLRKLASRWLCLPLHCTCQEGGSLPLVLRRHGPQLSRSELVSKNMGPGK